MNTWQRPSSSRRTMRSKNGASVTTCAAFGGPATQVVCYSYDVENRWLGQSIDAGDDGTIDRQVRFAYDGHQIVLQFAGDCPDLAAQNGTVPFALDGDGNPRLTAANLAHRYLWGPAVDQLLADEQVASPQTPGSVVWPLADNLGTVRDLAVHDAQSGVTSVANHRVYDSFGKLVSQTNAAVDCLFGFTGLPFDEASGTNRTPTRPYDPATGRWLQADWIGFGGVDANLSRYVGNSPTSATDPTGQWKLPIHTAITLLAAMNTGYDVKSDLVVTPSYGFAPTLYARPSFIMGLHEGSRWPDVPLNSLNLPRPIVFYDSHLGNSGYWHGMAIRIPELGRYCTRQRMQELIVDQIINWYNEALAAPDGMTAGAHIGRALHLIEDSYTPSHVVRAGGTGLILQFQDYMAQDWSKHAKDDVPHGDLPGFPSNLASYEAAVAAATQLLQFFKDRASAVDVQAWLVGPHGPLALDANATVGGTDAKYLSPPYWPQSTYLLPVKCFAAGTPVLCPDGPRAIETLRVGDRVLAYDRAAQRVVESRVLECENTEGDFEMLEVETPDGNRLQVTAEHAFFDGDQWVSSREVAEGHPIIEGSGQRVSLSAVAPDRRTRTRTYNIRTTHKTYLVGLAGLVAADRGVWTAKPAGTDLCNLTACT